MRDRGMSEGEASKSHDETSGGKRRHTKSRRYQEYLEQQHSQTVPEKLKKCPDPSCNKVFSSGPGLRYHVNTVHATKVQQYSCQRCQKNFKSSNGLKYHLEKTKCQGEMSMSNEIKVLHFPIPSLHSESRDAYGHTEQAVTSPVREAETKYAAEPRHRKMEARRKRMKEAQLTLPPQTQQGPESERLREFAEIATGPQSPLLRSTQTAIDWDKVNLSGPKQEAGTISSESSTPEQYSTAVAVLSSMALRKQGQHTAKDTKQTKQKGKRPMNAFILWSKQRRPHYKSTYPEKDNREISKMLSAEWHQLDKKQKHPFEEEAKRQAAKQRQQFPDCWKRKK